MNQYLKILYKVIKNDKVVQRSYSMLVDDDDRRTSDGSLKTCIKERVSKDLMFYKGSNVDGDKIVITIDGQFYLEHIL
jgi:hypothetical protein